MDVLSIIKKEHREVGSLIDEADKCEPGDDRLVEVAREIESKLSLHLAIEERLFYAKLRTRSEEEKQQVDIFEAYTEHEVAKRLIEMLRPRRKGDARFKAELQVLGESVKHHVEEEESKVFGVARQLLNKDELEAIGASWEKAKQRALAGSRSRPASSSSKKRAVGRRKA